MTVSDARFVGLYERYYRHMYAYCRRRVDTDKVEDADEWFSSAERHDGSWWVDWAGWLASNSGEMVDARKPGDNEIAVLYDAPGEYVRVRSG